MQFNVEYRRRGIATQLKTVGPFDEQRAKDVYDELVNYYGFWDVRIVPALEQKEQAK